MIVRLCNVSRPARFGLAALLLMCVASPVMAVSNSFMAVLNEQSGFSDSRRSLTFYDANDIGGGPLFSVFAGFEIHGGSSQAYEDASAFTVDPSTGDVYFIAFDSGNTAGQVDRNLPPNLDPNGDPGAPAVDVPDDDDTIADWDLYRINFQTVLNHWTTNMEGRNVRTGSPMVNLAYPAPTATAGSNATEMQDYVTYGSTTPYVEERMQDGTHGPSPDGVFDARHSNTFILDGAIEKIGELDRNRVSSSPFHVPSLSFIAEDKLFMIDDFRQDRSSPHVLANDGDYRMIERVSTSPGAATSDGTNGGYNNTTTESWRSRRVGQVLLDADDGFGSFLSEPMGTAYHDTGGVRGVWVTDRDTDFVDSTNPVPDTSSGDDIAFLQLDANFNSLGYRQFTLAGNPTKFDMEHDPANPGFAGRVGNIFVDEDTGDLIVVEEGFQDNPNPPVNGPGFHEPAVIRMSGINYDSAGKIALGTWGPRMVLTPTKDGGDTLVERGYWSAYDSATDKVYFSTPGFGSESNPFQMDIFVLDLATGTTTSFNNTDESVAMFTSAGNVYNADKVIAFTLPGAGIPGDYNGDGQVDAADYVLWRKSPGDFGGNPAGYNTWRQNYGNMGPGAGGGSGLAAVPEPASAVLLVVGLVALFGYRRAA